MTIFKRGNSLLKASEIVLLAIMLVVACWGTVSFFQHSKFNQQGDGGEARVETSVLNNLPFELEGVKYNAPVLEISGGEDYAALHASWEFGGDYAQIGSFPLDSEHVFGSSSSTPDDIATYSASVINSSLQVLQTNDAPNTINDLYFEPQDGTGNTSFVVWRAATFSNSAIAVEDSWALQYAEIVDGELQEPIVLDTAKELNQTDDTPRIYGEVVPTFNDSSIYFASNVLEEDVWKCKILEYDLESKARKIIEAGSYPAAIDSGVVFASNEIDNENAVGYTSVSRHSDGVTEEVFHLKDTSNWNIAGIWACGEYRAVCVSPLSESHMPQGSYVGLWSEDFSKPLAWLHVGSPTVVGSINNDWFVWGSGSQGINPEMYAFNWSTNQIIYLGSAVGYSRPAIARDSNVVLVPFAKDEFSALSYRVGILE